MARVLRRKKAHAAHAAEAPLRTEGAACLVGGLDIATAATVIAPFDTAAAAAVGGEVGAAGVGIELPTDLLAPMPIEGFVPPQTSATSATELSGSEVAVALTPRVAMAVAPGRGFQPPPRRPARLDLTVAGPRLVSELASEHGWNWRRTVPRSRWRSAADAAAYVVWSARGRDPRRGGPVGSPMSPDSCPSTSRLEADHRARSTICK